MCARPITKTLITLQPLEPHQIPEAKFVIARVARATFGWEESLEELLKKADEDHELADVDDAGDHYFGNRGLFLVAMDGERIVGTGAVRRLDEESCELKRMWLFEEYHGQGIGYRMIQELFAFARWAGYTRIELNTSVYQERAIQFYQRVGFEFMEMEDDMGELVFMERAL